MKFLRISVAVLASLVILSLSVSVLYTHVVKPIEIRILISKGCSEYSQIANKAKPTAKQVDSMSHYFGKLARLEPKYLQVATAVDGFWFLNNGQSHSENLNPQFVRDTFVLYSFCAR